MAYGLNKNLLSRRGVINMYESWNVNGVQDTTSNNKKSNSNDLLTSHSSYFDKRVQQNNIRHSTTILPPKQFPSKSQRPSTCASVKIIHSTASLPCRPSTANNCTRFHDNMLKALMRNIDKYCGKDGTNENPPNTLTPSNVKQEKDKKKKNVLESNTMVDIDKFIKHHQKINETVENNVNTQNRKNTKPTGNKRKKSKSNTVKRGLFDETVMTAESKTSVNVQSTTVNSGNSQLKDDKIKDIVNEDAAWEITDSDQIRNLVMPRETRNATLTLLNEKKFKEGKKVTYQSNNNILGNVPLGIRKPINPSIKPLSKGGKSSLRDGGNLLVNDYQTLNVCPHNLLCDGQNCNHRIAKKLASTFSQPHLHNNVMI
ncbi:uncharacterized protein LOC123296121 [Chrysoperla carnea]|uniref:uncharacterized protein LOC123296121 n=1 Tax=Chrysoperla carnea TaxID=189513 RepID=UPI001D08983C|nr:uncharacterized protein LOC123296121 [Chrysoperla carnea]